MKNIFRLLFVLIFILIGIESNAQLHIGPKGGINIYSPIYKDAVMYDGISSKPGIGFNIGGALDYNVNKKFSLYTEFLYSHMGKHLTGGIKDQFRHNASYNYLEVPVLARLTYKGNIKKRHFKWYLNAGGTFNYWLSGKGSLKSFEFEESAVDQLDYTIKFKPKPENTFDEEFTIYISEPTRLQVGLVFGGGFLFDINPQSVLEIDLRYTFRQSWLGRDHEVDVGLTEYYEDFRTMEHIFSIGAAYLFKYDIGQGRKGKSTKGAKMKSKTSGKPQGTKGQNINKIKKNKN